MKIPKPSLHQMPVLVALAAVVVASVGSTSSTLNPQATGQHTQTSSKPQHSTTLQLHPVLGGSTSPSGSSSTNTSGTTAPGGSNGTNVAIPPNIRPTPTPTPPKYPCSSCPATDSNGTPIACPDFCVVQPPPVNHCGGCGGTYGPGPRPEIMCRMVCTE